MKTITKIRILNALGLFNAARWFYYRREAANPQIRGFYSQFIRPDSLCFDIGANIGRKADVFLGLGARVVALEPNAECAAFLRWKYRFNKRVTIINKAVDSWEGKKDLFICEANSLSSLSAEWVELTKASGRYRDFNWGKKAEVTTTTLDRLVRKYGRPDYCKIDVEGYEANVLRGLTQPLTVISFELAPESMEVAQECITYLSGLGAVSFNISSGETAVKFVLPQWVSGVDIARMLNPTQPQYYYGEVYAQFET